MTGDPVARVLVVDDDAVQREAVQRQLGPDYEVLQAAYGAEALEMMERHPVSMVLLDYRLPGEDGLELLPRFLAFEVPVLMLTARGSERVAVQAMQKGCADYLIKADVTPALLRKTIEASLHRHRLEQELSSRQAELESFVGTAAHDLASPLHSVYGFADLLKMHLGDAADPEVRKCLDRIASGIKNMRQLLDDLLAYTRVGRNRGGFAPVPLGELLPRVLQNLDQEIASAAAQIEFGDLPTVPGDASALGQLFQNLISNAIRYRSSARPRIKVRAEARSGMWRFEVVDNGKGIPAAERERVFQPLVRLDRADPARGTGLGLAICRRVVAQHGGKIRVEEVEGGGSAFVFELQDPGARVPSGLPT